MENTKLRTIKSSFIVTLFFGMMICSVQAASPDIDNLKMKTTQTKAWTQLYYLDCDYDSNNFDPLEQIFIDEIASSENVDNVVILDREEEPAFLYYIDEDNNKILLDELGEVNMGDPQTLADFINYGKQNYPAERYLLWVYDHGGGWKGACMDVTNNDPLLSMEEFQQALTDAGGVDIISFYACLMSSIESVYELRDVVDVYVGSEDLAYGTWFDHICGDTNQLLAANPMLSSDAVGIEIVNFYEDHDYMYKNKLTMSAIKAQKIVPLVEALDDLSKSFITHWLRSYRHVRKAHNNTFLLANLGEWAEAFEVYDLKGFLENLPDSPEKTVALEAFDEALLVEVHGTSMEETNGLSIFFPAHKSPYELAQEYKDAGLMLDFPKDTWWNEFLFFFILTNTILRR